MKLPTRSNPNNVLAKGLLLALTLLPSAHAAIPSGRWQIQISDGTNRVWDVTPITELQSMDVEFPDDEVIVSFDGPFLQNGAGKQVGSGATQLEVASPVFDGTVAGTYLVKGSITSAKGIAKLTFSSSAKGTTLIDGRSSVISSSFGGKVAINSQTESVTGTYTAAAAASGYGSVKEAGAIDFPWNEAIAAMGNGLWSVHLILTNDTVKKVGGTATVNLSTGATLDFTVKGKYNPKTDSTLLVLAADAESKGSSLKVTLNAGTQAPVQGKLTGQSVKTVGTISPE